VLSYQGSIYIFVADGVLQK